MDRRQALLDHLKKLVREKRATINPAVLAKAQRVAEHTQQDDKIPYDRKSAAKAVDIFLKSHPDQQNFRVRLLEFLSKQKP